MSWDVSLAGTFGQPLRRPLPLLGIIVRPMATDADKLVRQLLHTNDDFLMAIGMLTLAFAAVEEELFENLTALIAITGHQELNAEVQKRPIAQLRLMDKRDLLKRVAKELGHFYQVDSAGIVTVLNELGGLNRKRRAVIHGWIRWSHKLEQPVFKDAHNESVSAWPSDVAKLTMDVNEWIIRLLTEHQKLNRAISSAYEAAATLLINHPRTPLTLKPLLVEFKERCLLDSIDDV